MEIVTKEYRIFGKPTKMDKIDRGVLLAKRKTDAYLDRIRLQKFMEAVKKLGLYDG